jgi:polysaccharide biosynthesis transport protein
LTIVSYERATRVYMSKAGIVIRSADFNEVRLDKNLTLAANFLASDPEMMLILNELDLFANARRTQPYERSVTRLRGEIILSPGVERIDIAFMSNDAKQAKRVVEFVTERVMHTLSRLFEAPFTSEIDVIQRTLQKVEPKLKAAENALFEFKNKHPRISSDLTVLDGVDSPVSALDAAIRQAVKEVAAAKTGRALARPRKQAVQTPSSGKLREAKLALKLAKQTYTSNHPRVVKMARRVAVLEAKVQVERGGIPSNDPPRNGAQRRAAQISAAKARLSALIQKRTAVSASLIQKPKLQQAWQALSLKVATLNSEVRELMERRRDVLQNQSLAQSNFYKNFQLVDPAFLPKDPVEPKIQKYGGIGMFLTAALGLLAALSREGFRQTFVNSQEVEEATGLPVLSILPAIPEEEA